MTTVEYKPRNAFALEGLCTRELCGIFGLWLNQDEGGVCVGVVGMVMVNSM